MGNADSKNAATSADADSSPTNKKIQSLTAAKDQIDPRIAKYLVERLKSPDREKSFMRIILKVRRCVICGAVARTTIFTPGSLHVACRSCLASETNF